MRGMPLLHAVSDLTKPECHETILGLRVHADACLLEKAGLTAHWHIHCSPVSSQQALSLPRALLLGDLVLDNLS